MNIHIVGVKHPFVKLNNNEWESGSLPLEESKAQQLVGGDIFFHKTRTEPSYYGGRILDYRVDEEEENRGRIIFKLKYLKECRNVKTEKTGWSKAIKIIGLDHELTEAKSNG